MPAAQTPHGAHLKYPLLGTGFATCGYLSHSDNMARCLLPAWSGGALSFNFTSCFKSMHCSRRRRERGYFESNKITNIEKQLLWRRPFAFSSRYIDEHSLCNTSPYPDELLLEMGYLSSFFNWSLTTVAFVAPSAGLLPHVGLLILGHW